MTLTKAQACPCPVCVGEEKPRGYDKAVIIALVVCGALMIPAMIIIGMMFGPSADYQEKHPSPAFTRTPNPGNGIYFG